MCHKSDSIMCRSPTSKLLKIEAFLRHLKKDKAIKSTSNVREDSEALRSTKALQESSLKAFKNFNLKIEEHLKHNHPNYLPRSQRLLESSSKAFRKPQQTANQRSSMDLSL